MPRRHERPKPRSLEDPYDYLAELQRGDYNDHLRAVVLDRLLILEEQGVSDREICRRHRRQYGLEEPIGADRISKFKRGKGRPVTGRPDWGWPPTLPLQELAAAGFEDGQTPEDLQAEAIRNWLKAGGRAVRELL